MKVGKSVIISFRPFLPQLFQLYILSLFSIGLLNLRINQNHKPASKNIEIRILSKIQIGKQTHRNLYNRKPKIYSFIFAGYFINQVQNDVTAYIYCVIFLCCCSTSYYVHYIADIYYNKMLYAYIILYFVQVLIFETMFSIQFHRLYIPAI